MIQEAEVDFVDGAPHSRKFRDRYAASDPIEECLRVHARPAGLITRAKERSCFSIFELGFGAGINFLTLAEEFIAQTDCQRLRFFSCELHPLRWLDLEKTLAPHRHRLRLTEQLLDAYPPPIPGIHRQLFAQDRIELSLCYGDVVDVLEDFLNRDHHGIDAWILDGFAPDRNPRMWQPDLFKRFVERTREGGTVTSFSAAGSVRRSLNAAGFKVQRIDNAPLKRHTTFATLPRSKFSPRKQITQSRIFGGGFAGASTAHALARRGVQVELNTLTGDVADQTSEIPVAILHGRLSADFAPQMLTRAHAYTYSRSLVPDEVILQTSAVQLANRHMSASRLENVGHLFGSRWVQPLSNKECKQLTNLSPSEPACLFPRSVVVDGSALCRFLTTHDNITVVRGDLQEHEIENKTDVIATRTNEPILPIAKELEIADLEGQIDFFSTEDSDACPRMTVVSDGYCVPSQDSYVVGSTYEYTPWSDGKATRTNLARLRTLSPSAEFKHLKSFRASRAVTSDRMPVVGRTAHQPWLNLGHGSSGTTTAPFAGEALASLICGELPPGSADIIDALSPGRFTIRQQKRPNPFATPRSKKR